MLWLARHGQTEMNAAGRYQGRIDSPLNALGVRQAQVVGVLLAGLVDRARTEIVASPLQRAVRTAEIIGEALCLPVRTEARLTEVGMGAWEGLTADQIDAGWAGARAGSVRNGWFFEAPGGEGHSAVVARLTALLADCAEGPDQIFVSHAIAGRILRGIWAGLPKERAFRLEIPQDAVFRLYGGGQIERCPG